MTDRSLYCFSPHPTDEFKCVLGVTQLLINHLNFIQMKNSITTKHEVTKKYFKGFKTFQFTLALFIAVLGVLRQHTLQAQNPMVFVNPSHSGGYLAWRDGGDSIKYWRIEVKERIALTDSTFGTKVIWRHEEWRQNYIQIPEQYQQKDISNRYGIDLIGYDVAHNIIATDEVIPLVPDLDWTIWVEYCRVTCNGPNYAWKVQQLIPINAGGHKYKLMPTYVNGNPIWEYMTLADWGHLTANFLPHLASYYGITPWDISNPEFSTDKFKTITNNPSVTYNNSSGIGISSAYHQEIKKVRKNLGPWMQVSNSDSYTSHLSGDPHGASSLCVNDNLQYAVALMNTYADFDPELVCEQQNYSGPTAGGSTGSWQDCDHLVDNLQNFNDLTGEELADSITVWINNWYECMYLTIGTEEGTDTTGVGGGAWGQIVEFSLSIIKGDGIKEVINKKSNEIINENGNFMPFSANLEPGLYYMYTAFAATSAVIPETYFELKNPIQINFNLSHFFNFTVFPVPHIEDQFSINMQATSDLNTRYELYDFQGNLVHRAHYQLKQGHNENHLIQPANPIPSGLLINRFTFDDGSVKTLTTLRQ
jgi:hypothetical protein